MIALELKSLVKRFGEVLALDRVSLRVEEGQFCVLLGPSGCGKTTALRCVAGLEQQTSGEVWIEGRCADRLAPKDRDVAMVFQSYALYPHLTVRRNIEFPLRMKSVPKGERERRVRESAALLRIEELLDRKPRALSGGQRQRVAIGRAIVRAPKLFLFDEPLSNLDARLRADMRVELARLHRELRATVLYVTHDQVEAMTLGQHIVVLNEGRIEQLGSPRGIYTRPATRFVAGFVGTPSMNFVSGRLEGGYFTADALRVPVSCEREGVAELGVRPEHVRLGGEQVTARVEWIEELGADRYAHLRVGSHRFVARCEAAKTPAEGNETGLSFDRSGVHIFADGKRIDTGGR